MVAHLVAEHHGKAAEHNRKAAQHHYEARNFVAAAEESYRAFGQRAAAVLHTARAATAHATHVSRKK